MTTKDEEEDIVDFFVAINRGDVQGILEALALVSNDLYAFIEDAQEIDIDFAETPFDVAVLDRRLGDTTGSDVLEQIRRQTEDTRVIMLTAVTPDVDILSMPFNEYLIKPVSGDDLVGTVAEMLARGRYLDCVDDLYVALRKLTLLQATTSDAELRADPEYCRLTETVDDLRRQADEAFSALDSPAGVLRELA